MVSYKFQRDGGKTVPAMCELFSSIVLLGPRPGPGRVAACSGVSRSGVVCFWVFCKLGQLVVFSYAFVV